MRWKTLLVSSGSLYMKVVDYKMASYWIVSRNGYVVLKTDIQLNLKAISVPYEITA